MTVCSIPCNTWHIPSVRRVVGKPPADKADDLHKLLDTLYDLTAAHHSRQNSGRESFFLQDLRKRFDVSLFEVAGQGLHPDGVVRVHEVLLGRQYRPALLRVRRRHL